MKPKSTPESLGLVLAILWIATSAPDIMASFAGERATNDISVSPAWLKALRDVYAASTFMYLSRQTFRENFLWRTLWFSGSFFYVVLAVARNYEPAIAIRAALWIPVLAWTSSALPHDLDLLKRFVLSAFRILIPVSIVTSLSLGLFGADMYYEGIGIYQRNPGIMLAPSATAFLMCLSFLVTPRRMRLLRSSSLVAGVLSLSGIFYIMSALLFGRLNRLFYLSLAVAAGAALMVLGLAGVIDLLVGISGGIRSSDAVSLTLTTRLSIFIEALTQLSLIGNFPIGLNVAANQSIDQFFPDNAMLSAVYAFGIAGCVGFFVVLMKAFRSSQSGVFLLVLISSMFYVWFENIMLAGFTGVAINKYFSEEFV